MESDSINLPVMGDNFDLLALQADDIKYELDRMLDAKEITPEEYSKNIVLLAYEYAVNGYAEECIQMLTHVTEGYFSEHSFKHFNEDEIYFIKSNTIFEILDYAGFVNYDILATQKEASA
jgi:hypothetical protein